MDSLRGEFEAAWDSFQRLEDLRLTSDTLESEWMRGRDSYLAFLVRLVEAAAVSYLRELVRRIETIPGVEPYPEDYWHITVKGLGFEGEKTSPPDQIASSDIVPVANAAGDVFAQQPAFDARLGPANGFPEVVFAEVWDSLPVRQLNLRLLGAIGGIPVYPFDGPNFLPHISIARFTSNDGLPQLKELISSLRDQPPGPPFPVREVQLIRARLSDRAPVLETIRTYTLGSADS